MMKHRDEFCAEIESSLPLYVGGDLEIEAMAATEAHLRECASCAGRARAAREARDLLVSVLKLAGTRGPDVWAGVRAVLADEGLIRPTEPAAAQPLTPVRTARPRQWLRWTAAAAAAVILGFWLGQRVLDDETPGIRTPDRVTRPSIVDRAVPTPALPAAPAGGLRRVRPDEEPLRNDAVMFYDDRSTGAFPFDPNMGAPAGLRLVRSTQ